MVQTWIIVIAALYLSIFVSGFWLSRLGRPLNTILLTLHKLVSVAAVALLVYALVRANRAAALGALVWIVAGVALLFFLGTIATGAVLSADRPPPDVLLTLHRITPVLTVLSTAATFYLLLGRT